MNKRTPSNITDFYWNRKSIEINLEPSLSKFKRIEVQEGYSWLKYFQETIFDTWKLKWLKLWKEATVSFTNNLYRHKQKLSLEIDVWDIVYSFKLK